MKGEKSVDAANCHESSKIAGLCPNPPPPPPAPAPTRRGRRTLLGQRGGVRRSLSKPPTPFFLVPVRGFLPSHQQGPP